MATFFWDAEVAYFSEAGRRQCLSELAKNVAKSIVESLIKELYFNSTMLLSIPLFTQRNIARIFDWKVPNQFNYSHKYCPVYISTWVILPIRTRLAPPMAVLFVIQIHQLVNVIATVKKILSCIITFDIF